MNWGKVICAVHMMNVSRFVPHESVSFSRSPSVLVYLLVSLGNCAPSPSVHVLIYTPPLP